MKYSEKRHSTKISRWRPMTGNSSLSAVMIASDPPNCRSETVVLVILVDIPRPAASVARVARGLAADTPLHRGPRGGRSPAERDSPSCPAPR